MTSKLNTVGFIGLAAISSLAATSALAAGTTAGTTITNTATVDFQVGGVAQVQQSASDNFTVDRKINLLVEEVGTVTTNVVPGQTNAVTTFQLTNSSNEVLDFALVASQIVGGTAAPAPAPAPATETPQEVATTLAALVVQVDEASAVASPFSELLLKVAQVVRLVEGERDGHSDPFSDAEWILTTSLVDYFRNGMPPLKAGSTLRQFLATLLNRVPKALTQKFAAEEMELGKQTFEPQDVDLTKAARTFRDQVAEFVAVAPQRAPLYVSEQKGSKTNPWQAQVTIPPEHRKVRDKEEPLYLGVFPTKKAAACAIDAFIEDDYRFNAKYVREKSNRIKYREDFATMDDEMTAAAEVGRSKATKEAPAPAPAAAAASSPRLAPAVEFRSGFQRKDIPN